MKLFSLATSVFIVAVSLGGTSGLEVGSALREVNPRQKSFRPGLGALRQNGQLRGKNHQAFGFPRAERK